MKISYEAHNTERRKPYIYHKDGAGFHSHWHENIEILHFFRNGNILCGRDDIAVSAGEFAVINSDVLHTIEARPESFYDCFIPDTAFCRENGIDVTKLNFKTKIADDGLTNGYARLTEEIKENNSFSEAGVKAAILDVMVYLCRNFSCEKTETAEKDLSIKKAIIYINSNYTEQMTIDEIASNAALSKYYFCREFKKVTGYSAVQYINMTRCRAAEKILAGGSTVGEAAEAVGYDNLSYFSKTFRTVTGHLPGEYKKYIGKREPDS